MFAGSHEFSRWLASAVALVVLVSLLGPGIAWAAQPGEKTEEEEEPATLDPAPPAPEPPVFRLSVVTAASDANDRNIHAILNYRRSSKLIWNFTFGHSQIGSTPVFEFNYGKAGLRYGGPETSFFVNLGFWGDESLIGSKDLDLGVILKKSIWQWTLGAEYRQIDSDVTGLVGEEEFSGNGSAQARGLFSRLQVQATPSFLAYVSAADNKYAAATAELEALFGLRLIASRSVTLISQFPDWNYSVGATFSRGRERFNLDYTVVQTIFKNLRPEIFTGAVTVPVGSGSTLSFRAGQRNTPGFSKVYFTIIIFNTGF